MKRLRALLIAVVTCVALHSTTSFAAAPPIATLTVKNHTELLATVSRIAEAARPGMGIASAAMLPAFLGAPEMAGVDPNRPWQAAAWSRATGGGSLAVYVPVTDFDAFKAGLTPGILAGGRNENTVADKNGYAVIFNPNKGGFTDDDRDKALNWKVSPAKTDATINLYFAPDDTLKQMMLSGFRAGREKAMQGMMKGLQAAPKNAAFDPEAMGEIMNFYFSVIDTALAGFVQFNLSLSVTDEDIVIGKQISAAKGSDLARWFAPNPDGVAADINAVDWDSAMAFAVSVRSDPTLSSFIEKAMALGFKMQGIPQDSEQTQETMKLIKGMLPFVTAGSMSFDDNGMNFGGYYRFPDRKADDYSGKLIEFMDGMMKKQTGDDKMYKAYEYKKAVRTLDGVSIDRLSMTYNLDSPLLQAPGQKEQIQAMFPGGKAEVEYALANGKLFFTMGATKMENILKPPTAQNATPARVKAGPKTTFVGQMNLLTFVKGMFMQMPFSPLPKQIVEAIDPAGTGIQTRVNQTGALDMEVRAPLKLIQSVAKTVFAVQAAKAQQNAN